MSLGHVELQLMTRMSGNVAVRRCMLTTPISGRTHLFTEDARKTVEVWPTPSSSKCYPDVFSTSQAA